MKSLVQNIQLGHIARLEWKNSCSWSLHNMVDYCHLQPSS